MRWVTREKVKVDRVAYPWLIRRFIDSEAEFVGSSPILSGPPPSNPHPAGEGLRWIAHGFSALGLSDHREFIVYDALYAECQKRTGGNQ